MLQYLALRLRHERQGSPGSGATLSFVSVIKPAAWDLLPGLLVSGLVVFVGLLQTQQHFGGGLEQRLGFWLLRLRDVAAYLADQPVQHLAGIAYRATSVVGQLGALGTIGLWIHIAIFLSYNRTFSAARLGHTALSQCSKFGATQRLLDQSERLK